MKQKQIIRLTESELKSIIAESVKHILCEAMFNRQDIGTQMAAGVLDPNFGNDSGSKRTDNEEHYANNIISPTAEKYWVRNNYGSDPMTNGKIPQAEKGKRIDAYREREKYNKAGFRMQGTHPEVMQKQKEREQNAFTHLDPLQVRQNAYDLMYDDSPSKNRKRIYKSTRKPW